MVVGKICAGCIMCGTDFMTLSQAAAVCLPPSHESNTPGSREALHALVCARINEPFSTTDSNISRPASA